MGIAWQNPSLSRSIMGLNSEVFLSTDCHIKAKELSLPNNLPITGGKTIGFLLFPRVLELIGLVGKVFANSPGDLGSIQRFIPKTLKMVLDTSLLNTQQYKVRIKGKVEQSRERSSALPTPRCSSYWKRSLWVVLDYGCQLYY